MNYKYCNNLFSYSRFLTREVNIGGVPLGGSNPIRLQSMTNTNTLDTDATVEQCIKIIKAGADYVRITTPGIREAENLIVIKKKLNKLGYISPLIADIHFNPKVAEVAAAIVEKIRINPGNYSDKKRFEQINYTDSEYKQELEKIHTKLLPLLKICREHGTAVRIGVNHGSLSDRIMNRYGDTPRGMVESAMEFLRICNLEGFHNLVVSLKASNTRIMVQAYRLLVNTMIAEKMNFPLHLGVTEAGEGEDGRIKSAVGIGSLLADGLGDTIRVSLTENPENEIPIARELVNYFKDRKESNPIPTVKINLKNPFEYQQQIANSIENIGGKNFPVVIIDWNNDLYEKELSYPKPEYFYLNTGSDFNSLPVKYSYILNMHDWFKHTRYKSNIFPLMTEAEFTYYGTKHPLLNFVIVSNLDNLDKLFETLQKHKNVVLILETFNTNGVADQRSFLYQLISRNINVPLIINRNYCEKSSVSLLIKSASDFGPILIDGFGNGIWIRNAGVIKSTDIISMSFGILQASRVRTSKTEYISCPSCGRTLFDMQSLTSTIKNRTNHLKNLKIAIMGCNVNGPGEMADADYGYVGAGPGIVTLYKGKTIIKKNIPSEVAVDELISLIKENGDWFETPKQNN